MSCDIAVIGLGTMGSNIARNFAHHNVQVAVYNRSYERTEALLKFKDENVTPTKTIEELVGVLKAPRKILLMVTDGAVDAVVKPILPLLSKGDIIIDGGNSYWKNTERRQKEINPTGVIYVGMGISGGEEGALNGPSMMFGGERSAWEACKPVLLPIAAKSAEGQPCVDYMGSGGAGHFVKMVHNAIEYADMQLIAETYDILTKLFKLDAGKIADIFGSWNKTVLKSYLIQITEAVLNHKEGDVPLVNLILDRAAQKGTGKWAAQDSFDFAIPTPGFCEAVSARVVSFMKEERVAASKVLNKKAISTADDLIKITVEDLEKGLYAAKIACYAQGFAMIQAASIQNNYGVDIAACARVWRGGCIIRADFLNDVAARYKADTKNLMMIDHFAQALESRLEGWRKVVALTALKGIPAPLFASTLAYFDSYSSEVLPANLLQGLRDYFGAHTYERVDKPGNFHTEW
ncbi:6-phosphogluconate dehydrogenase [Tritrichomonas foetus]|uniref:6-phosphogluconate dehydrogenase, decarboxylating n=1 Tax=Tritrichomonas foetus TaxID=1144522 RepID=A0A1J4JWM2_9EUKA|nr:6-phosphogluconate dehydrogenase [Tritrichomonas foetus]|eukprot:OHT01932.1 6-phosphogluconate dehydrogenase [Tritrichomonas foetus]